MPRRPARAGGVTGLLLFGFVLSAGSMVAAIGRHGYGPLGVPLWFLLALNAVIVLGAALLVLMGFLSLTESKFDPDPELIFVPGSEWLRVRELSDRPGPGTDPSSDAMAGAVAPASTLPAPRAAEDASPAPDEGRPVRAGTARSDSGPSRRPESRPRPRGSDQPFITHTEYAEKLRVGVSMGVTRRSGEPIEAFASRLLSATDPFPELGSPSRRPGGPTRLPAPAPREG